MILFLKSPHTFTAKHRKNDPYFLTFFFCPGTTLPDGEARLTFRWLTFILSKSAMQANGGGGKTLMLLFTSEWTLYATILII